MKRILTFLLVALTAFALFAQATGEVVEERQMVAFTDDLGRTVMVPEEITSVCPSGSMAQVILLTFDQSLLSGLTTPLEDGEAQYYPDLQEDLPVLGTFYGKKANLNKEALIVANPDVVVDIGEIKGSEEEMISDLDVLQEQIGIPVVFIENYLSDSAHTYEKIGQLLGDEERAGELSAWANEAVEYASQVKSQHEGTVSFYYSSSVDGLEVIPESNFHGEVLEAVGGRNVCPATFSSGGNAVSLEQIFLWNPDVIILSSPQAYETVTAERSDWSSLDAVSAGRVYLVPDVINNWIDSPPSINRLIGIYWAAEVLFNLEYDVEAKAQEFYQLFYGWNLE